MISVDIATKIISPTTQIWVVFPGKARRFINIFLSHDAVFLETPALRINSTIANDRKLLRQHTRASIAIANYARSASGNPPSRNPASYSDEPFQDRGKQVLATNIGKMFGKVRKGDLIAVPGRILAPVYFGEIVSDFTADDVLNVERYGSEKIPFRRVRWLNAGVPRQQIALELQVYLSKPPAIARVPRSFQTDEFFKYAYPSFVLAEKSAVIMDGPKYDGKNPLATHEANFLVSYFISAFSAIEQERLDDFSKMDVRKAIAAFYDKELVLSFTQNFNSPGKFGLAALSAAMAVFVSAGIAISLQDFSLADLQNGIDVTNSISPHDAHIAKDSGIKLDYLFNALHKKEIEEINSLAKQAKDNIGLTTPVQVEGPTP